MAESESSEPDEPRTLTVVGMSGETLLDAVEVSSLAELQELVSARMTTEPGKRLRRKPKLLQHGSLPTILLSDPHSLFYAAE